MKPAAAEPRFLKHTGPAIVFEDYAEMKSEIDRDDLDVTPDHVMVLKNAGPHGRAGHARMGHAADPEEAREAGVRDMLRISDARMSGTSYGACVLHVAPEAYVGGPLALVRNGDIITVDVASAHDTGSKSRTRSSAGAAPPGRRRRRATSAASAGSRPSTSRQADEGCDFDFLETSFGKAVEEPAIY